MFKPITTARIVAFHKTLTQYYYVNGRHDMLWRKPDKNGNFDPYKIMVSELMLQQTQVDRVTPKYSAFLAAFPDVATLAAVELSEVLKLWSGLGYNRRAKYIWQTAGQVVHDYEGHFPDAREDLQRLPGIGPNTAGAIMAYAYNQPVVFVETNIRTVILYHFFKDMSAVPDADISSAMAAVIPQAGIADRAVQGAVLGPREFYWAMMDYGTHLKKTVGNLNHASKHYSKQAKFHGSKRQLRGQIIKLLTDGPQTIRHIQALISDERLDAVIDGLIDEGLLRRQGNTLRLG